MKSKEIKVLYICDREKCADCYEECMHTTDITHAKNFKAFERECFIERFNEEKENGI